jgi:hypothetical protein
MKFNKKFYIKNKMNQNEHLQQKYDRELLKTKELKRDVSDLKLLLQETRKALTREIASESIRERLPERVIRT